MVYDGDNIALSFNGSGTQTHRYLYGPETDQILADETASGNVLWALSDHQGTVRDLVDSTGTILNHIRYDSFGNVTSQTNPAVNTRYGYTGRELDAETGQYYYRARYYDPAVGQFISSDPMGFAGGDANLYRYVFNSPLNATDPTGNDFALPFPTGGISLPSLSGVGRFLSPLGKVLGPAGSLLYNPFGGGLLNPDSLNNGEDEKLRQLQMPHPPSSRSNNTPNGVGGVGGFNDRQQLGLPSHTGYPPSENTGGERLGGFNGGERVGLPHHTGQGSLDETNDLVRNCFDSANKLPRYEGPKPDYHINPAHVPGPQFNPKKTPLPNDAEEVFKRAIPDSPTNPRNWYGINKDGAIYRYSSANDGTAHFSGRSDYGDGLRNISRYAAERLKGQI